MTRRRGQPPASFARVRDAVIASGAKLPRPVDVAPTCATRDELIRAGLLRPAQDDAADAAEPGER